MSGLDKTEAAIYQAILAGPATDASGLSAQTGLLEAHIHSAPLHIEWLAGLDSLRAQAEDLTRGTKDLLQVTVAASQDAGGWQAGILPEASWTATGVTIELLYHASARDNPMAMSQAARPPGPAWQARITRNLPPVLMISDQQAALIPLEPARPGNGSLYIREPVIVALLATLFRSAWEAARPLQAQHPAEGSPAINARERALLRYLAAGLTVEAAARRLGISARTAGRLVATLMGKLGATSRLQAGYEATRRGWL